MRESKQKSLLGCCVDRRYGERVGKTMGCNGSTCMQLPSGKTCDNCRHHSRRKTVFGLDVDGSTTCGWFPRRFSGAQ